MSTIEAVPRIPVGEWQTIAWSPDSERADDPRYRVSFISNHPFPDTLYIAGLNQKRLSIEGTVRALGKLDVRTVGIEMKFPDDSVEAIENTMAYAPTAVADHIRVSKDEKLTLIGESLGGGIGLVNADRHPDQYGAIALWNPLGLTNEAIHLEPRRRPKGLIRRLSNHDMSQGRAWVLPPREEIDSLLRQLEYATAQDGPAILQRVAQHHDMAVFSGGEDTVFKTRELTKELAKVGLSGLVRRVEGGHSSRKQMVKIARWLHSLKTPELAT